MSTVHVAVSSIGADAIGLNGEALRRAGGICLPASGGILTSRRTTTFTVSAGVFVLPSGATAWTDRSDAAILADT